MGEDALVARAARGDSAAYEELVRAHQQAAFRAASFIAGRAEADDAVQEAFFKAFCALPSYRLGTPFRPWLLRIVINESRNRVRSRTRHDTLIARAGAARLTVVPGPEDSAVVQAQRAALAEAVDALPEHQRLVVVCRYLLELSESETADVLGIPKGSVKSRLSRGLDALRSVLEEVHRG